jgi:hypothetical protein
VQPWFCEPAESTKPENHTLLCLIDDEKTRQKHDEDDQKDKHTNHNVWRNTTF